MSTLTGQSADFAQNVTPTQSGASASFASFGDFLNIVKEPEYERQIQKKHWEDLGIRAMILQQGAEVPVERDTELYHFEETRSYIDGTATANAAIAPTDSGAVQFNEASNSVRLGDVVVINGEIVARVTARATNSWTATPYDASWGITVASGAAVQYFVSFNEFSKGTNQPTQYLIDNLERVESRLMILKDRFTMTGSQMTDKTWVDGLKGTGAYIFRAEEKGYMRFLAYQEMAMVYGRQADNANLSSDFNGTKGLFQQITERGNVIGDYLTTLADFEDLTEVLDAQAGPANYAAFLNPRQYNLAQNLISDATGLVSWGMFDNEKDIVDFNFKGLHVSGYDFMLKKWGLLTNPQLGGKVKAYKGAMIPVGTVKTQEGNLPHLSMLYKQKGGYSRKFESQTTGFANGVGNDPNGFDGLNMDYRSEIGARGVAMNAFVLIK